MAMVNNQRVYLGAAFYPPTLNKFRWASPQANLGDRNQTESNMARQVFPAFP